MIEDYNKETHDYLLRYSEQLKKDGKFIENENYETYIQFLIYSKLVYSELNWLDKDEYLKIFNDFLTNKIDNIYFCSLLDQKRKLNEALVDTLPISSISKKAEQFSDLIDNLSLCCQIIDRTGSDFEECVSLPNHINKIEFRNRFENFFFELQKFLQE